MNMEIVMKRLAFFALLVGACAVADEDVVGGETGSENSALHGERPSLRGWTTPGFCADLSEVLGSSAEDSMGRIGVSGAVKCFRSYGVDGVGFWGIVRAGYIDGVSSTPSAEVNGRTVGSMDVVISGVAADQLFDAMSGTWSVHLPATEKVSPAGRVHCTQASSGESTCQLNGLVGINTSNLYF
jgi:hypothetical protein